MSLEANTMCDSSFAVLQNIFEYQRPQVRMRQNVAVVCDKVGISMDTQLTGKLKLLHESNTMNQFILLL